MWWCLAINKICCMMWMYPCLFTGWCKFPDNDGEPVFWICNLCTYLADPFISIARNTMKNYYSKQINSMLRTYIGSDFRRHLDYDETCIWLIRLKQLQLRESNSLIPIQTMSIPNLIMLSIYYLKIIDKNPSFHWLASSKLKYLYLNAAYISFSYFDIDFHQNYHRNGWFHRILNLDECIAHEMHIKMTDTRVLKDTPNICFDSIKYLSNSHVSKLQYSLGSLMAVITSLNPLLSVPQLSVTYFNVTKFVCVINAPINCFVSLHDTLYFCSPTAFAPS